MYIYILLYKYTHFSFIVVYIVLSIRSHLFTINNILYVYTILLCYISNISNKNKTFIIGLVLHKNHLVCKQFQSFMVSFNCSSKYFLVTIHLVI